MRKATVILFLAGLLQGEMIAAELSKPTFEGASYTVCKVDLRRDKLELHLEAPDGRPYANFDRFLASRTPAAGLVTFAMNAGMFEPDYQPVGVFVANGREQAPLNLRNGSGNFYLKPNGVFAVVSGRFMIVDSEDWSDVASGAEVELATQSGPLLVKNGMIHPKFSTTSTSRNIRNAVGVGSASEAFLVISEQPVTFHQLARFMKVGLGCDNALYLDGVVSSIYAPALRRKDAKHNLGPILAVVEREAAP